MARVHPEGRSGQFRRVKSNPAGGGTKTSLWFRQFRFFRIQFCGSPILPVLLQSGTQVTRVKGIPQIPQKPLRKSGLQVRVRSFGAIGEEIVDQKIRVWDVRILITTSYNSRFCCCPTRCDQELPPSFKIAFDIAQLNQFQCVTAGPEKVLPVGLRSLCGVKSSQSIQRSRSVGR